MGRAIWKGHISFGLIHIPVSLFSAERTSELHFHLVDTKNKARIRYDRVNEITREEVPWERITKAYEYEDDRYVLLSDADFKQAAPEVTQTIDLESFIDLGRVDPIYFEKPYYLVPVRRAEKSYVLLRETLRKTGKAGLARIVIRSRQYMATLMPYENALLIDLLRYDREVVHPKELELPARSISGFHISPKEIQMAEELVESMAGEWNPTAYKDEYRDRLLQFIEAKIKSGRTEQIEEAPAEEITEPREVIDIVDLLKKSLDKRRKPAHPKRRRA